MTDVLDRRSVPRVDDDLEGERSVYFRPTDAARAMLASLSVGAGAIHLALVPSHWNDSVIIGVGFALAGWFQLAFAALVLTRPSRALLRVAMLANLFLIGAWAVSRTWGLPFGSHSGHPESVGFVDLVTVGLEVALIAACAWVLRRPKLGSGSRTARFGLGGLVPIGVVVLTTAALVSPSAADHAAGSHGEMAGGHAHGGEVDDKGFSQLINGEHGHVGHPKPLDAETQRALDAQLAVTREVAEQYPTVADAVAAGFTKIGAYYPGIGQHYNHDFFLPGALNLDGVIEGADIRNVLSIIYSGNEPTSEAAGFMFVSISDTEPVGFVGDNDAWHQHMSQCQKLTADELELPLGPDNPATDAQCASLGGEIFPIDVWMVHVWSVPGYEVSDEDGGMFGDANRKLDCSDGTYYMLPLEQFATHTDNACLSAA